MEKSRYELAAALLGLPSTAAAKAAIKAMAPDKLAHLKSLVDWVEDYEKHETN